MPQQRFIFSYTTHQPPKEVTNRMFSSPKMKICPANWCSRLLAIAPYDQNQGNLDPVSCSVLNTGVVAQTHT
jgi:hypothetical protein